MLGFRQLYDMDAFWIGGWDRILFYRIGLFVVLVKAPIRVLDEFGWYLRISLHADHPSGLFCSSKVAPVEYH